jgi:tetratricopeptide (TPR) repeat protein
VGHIVVTPLKAFHYQDVGGAALAPVLEASAKDPADPAKASAAARYLHAWEQWDAALSAYQRARSLAPGDARLAYLQGVVLQRLARAEEAIVACRAAVTIDPAYLPARVRLAELLAASGDTGDSRTRFEALLRDPAAAPVAHLGLGRLLAAAGRPAEAITHLAEAVRLFPEFGAAHYALARAYRALGKADEARTAAEAHARFGTRWPAIEDPWLEEVTRLRGDATAALQRGRRLDEAGDLPGAIAAHEEALRIDPARGIAHVQLLALYGRTGQFDRAEAHYRDAIRVGHELDEAHYNYAVLLGLQARWPEAEAAYRAALAVNPVHAHARNNLGQLLERERRVEAAAAEYRQALEADPSFRLARLNLGRMLIAQVRPAEAVATLRPLAATRDADSPREWFALAVAHLRAGQRDEGVRLANEARALAEQFGQTELAAAIARDMPKVQP